MLSKPTFSEADGTSTAIFPQDCRIRNLTYAAPLYCDLKKRNLIGHEDQDTGEMIWQEEYSDVPEPVPDPTPGVKNRTTIGRVRNL